MMFTNNLIPRDHSLVKFIKKQKHIIVNTDISIFNEESKYEEILETGLYDWSAKNDKYLNLFE